MKRFIQIIAGSISAGLMVITVHSSLAQTTVESTTTTTAAGTISEFGPQQIVVKTESAPEPLRYRYTKTTTYVDEAGNPVSIETVKSGLPVTVYYDREGSDMVARKVIVRKTTAVGPGAAVESSKTTTVMGTVSEFDPQQIVVKTETAPEPLRYHYTKTTTYVDEAGNPVSVETVKSGLPVTVYYDREGDDMIARKVIVRRTPAVEPGTVIEHKKTTTTTQEK